MPYPSPSLYPAASLYPAPQTAGSGPRSDAAWPPVDAFIVTLAGLRMFGADGFGVEWYASALDGWPAADVRMDMTDRPATHGSYDPIIFYGARKLTLSGNAFARSPTQRRQAEARLSALTSALTGVNLRVDESPFARQVTVWRAGAPTVVASGPRLTFSVPLVAPDPVRYDVIEQVAQLDLPSSSASGMGYPIAYPFGFGGGASDVTVSNSGDATVFPALFIPGPVVNPMIRNDTTGDELDFNITVAGGDWLVIDPRERTVLLNGTANRRSAVVAGSRWPSLPPGLSTLQYRASSPTSSTAIIRWRSGWA